MPLVKRRQKYKIYEIKDKNILTNRKYIVKIKNQMLNITPFTSCTPFTSFTPSPLAPHAPPSPLLAANKQQYVHQCEKIHAGPDLEHGFHEDVQDHDEDEGLVEDVALSYADDERIQTVG